VQEQCIDASFGSISGGKGDGRPGVNFIIFLLAAFMLADPKSAKKTVKLSVFFLRFWDQRA